MIDETNFQPLRTLVLVRRDLPESTKGGIIIPANVQEYGWRATVIRGGPKAANYKEGDAIMFLKDFTVLPFKDRSLALTDGKHILAKLIVEGNIERIIPQNKFVLVHPFSADLVKSIIRLSDKWKKPPDTGTAIRKGPDCREVREDARIWFDLNIGVNCLENGVHCKLLAEENIIAMGCQD